MENYKMFFMLFSAVYLIIFGNFIKKGNRSVLSKGIGIYTLIFGVYSFISSLISFINNELGEILYSIFSVLLIITFIIILILNLITKELPKQNKEKR